MITCLHGEGNGNPLQYSCLENPMDRGAWQATVHGVTKSPTWQKQLSTQALKTHCYQQKFIVYITIYSCCQVALVVKNLPAKAEDARDEGAIPGSGRYPGVGNGTHSSTLAWKVPWTQGPGGLTCHGVTKSQTAHTQHIVQSDSLGLFF